MDLDPRWDEALEKILSDELGVVGREKHMDQIYLFLMGQLKRIERKQFLFLTGVPGTGKTASLMAILKILNAEHDLCMINAMEFEKPHQAYVEIARNIFKNHKYKDKMAKITKAKDNLDRYFRNAKAAKTKPIILFIDEVEHLLSRDQTVMSAIIEWSVLKTSPLILIGIANLVDLPERLNSNLYSRINFKRLIFKSYRQHELEKIIGHRLGDHVDLFKSRSVISFIAKKVASTKGDARLAFELCHQAISAAKQDAYLNPNERISIKHVNSGSDRLRSSPEISNVRAYSIHEKVLILSILWCLTYTDMVQELTLRRVKEKRKAAEYLKVQEHFFLLCREHDISPSLNYFQYDQLVYHLSQMGLIDYDIQSMANNKDIYIVAPLDEVLSELQSEEICKTIIKNYKLKEFVTQFS